MNKEECKKLVESYFDATNRHDVAAFDNMFAKDFVNYAAGFDPVSGCEAMKSLVQSLLEAFPDWHISVQDIIIENNKAAARWILTGTHKNPYKNIPATNLKIKVEGMYIDHIENGKIAKRWACNNFGDIFGMLQKHAASK